MHNDYFSAEEKVQLAYMSVKTEIMTQKAINSGYNAQEHGKDLEKIVRKDLTGKDGTNSEWTKIEYKNESKAIEITYTNSSLKKGGISEGKPAQDGKVEYKINLQEQDATLEKDVGAGGDTGGTGDGDDTPVSGIQIQEFSIAGTPVEPTVPDGFHHTIGTKDTGYVIEDGVGNEFVWVPVDKDQKITLKVRSEEEITDIKIYDGIGQEINLGISGTIGTNYSNENIEPKRDGKYTPNGLYRAVVTAGENSAEETLVVRSLYAVDWYSDYYSSDEGLNALATAWEESSSELLSDFDASSQSEFGPKYGQMMADGYSETEDYTSSVNNNGGFYIGRYEAGKENNSLVIKSGKSVWNNISQIDALSTANSYDDDKTGITSSLLTGMAWDRTLGWLINTGNKTLSQVAVDSTNWGNYVDEDDTNNPANTGTTSKAVSNNIYDLAGNVEEWTTEEGALASRVTRGGRYFNTGSDFPASSRIGSNPSFSNYGSIGFRLALYL